MDFFCGYSLPNDVIISYSSATVVNIVFTSDLSIQFEGFAIAVSFEEGISIIMHGICKESLQGILYHLLFFALYFLHLKFYFCNVKSYNNI